MNVESLVAVTRREGLSYEVLEKEHQQLLRPALIKDFCINWPAFGRWNLESLRDRFPDLIVPVDGRSVKLGAFIDEVLTASAEKPCGYLREYHFCDFLPEVLPELMPIPGYHRNRLNSRLLPLRGRVGFSQGPQQLLISGPGTHFPVLHYDFLHVHAYITQLQGDKEFTLFRPDETDNLYPKPDCANISQIDYFDPVDLERFPKFANARAVRFTARAGDTIFVPSGWWHYTKTLSPSLAITWNGVTRSNWNAFARDMYLDEGRQRGVKGALKRVYLHAVGSMMTALGK